MENIYKIDDILSGSKEINLKLNEILLKVKEYYARVAELDLAYKNQSELEETNFRDSSEIINITKFVDDLYHDINALKVNFIKDVSKGKYDEITLKDSLESNFQELDPFFTKKSWLDCYNIVNYNREEIHNNPDIKNELKLKEKKAITNIINLVSEHLINGEFNSLKENLNEKFKSMVNAIKKINFINEDLEKLINDKKNILGNTKDIIVTQNKKSRKTPRNINGINSRIAKKEEVREKLKSELDINKLEINKLIATMKKSNQDESLVLDINEFLAKNEEKARYSYSHKNISKEIIVLLKQINELTKQSIEGKSSDVYSLMENDDIITSDDQVDSLELKQIDEKLGVLYKEFFILHSRNNEIISNSLISGEENQDDFSLTKKRSAVIYECYKKNLSLYDLEDKMKNIDKFNSTEKRKIFSMIEQWKVELVNNAKIEDVLIKDATNATISKVEILSDSINGMADKASYSDNELIIQSVNQTFKVIGNLFANNFNR